LHALEQVSVNHFYQIEELSLDAVLAAVAQFDQIELLA
jgi:hypothetical protein